MGQRTCCRWLERRSLDNFHLGEGTEGDDGSLSSGCGWLDVLCVWSCELCYRLF